MFLGAPVVQLTFGSTTTGVTVEYRRNVLDSLIRSFSALSALTAAIPYSWPCRAFALHNSSVMPLVETAGTDVQKEDQRHLLRETENTMKFGLFSMVQVRSASSHWRTPNHRRGSYPD